jgi:hypothetical protein
MSWSIWAKGSKTHVKRVVSEQQVSEHFPPEEKEQVELAKTLILSVVETIPSKSAVSVEASGSMSVAAETKIGEAVKPREITHAQLSIKVEPIHLVGMSPND